MTLRALISRYVLFAVFATVANLLVQRLVFGLGDSNHVFVFAVGAGTLAGLVLKYILDKRWIFYDLEQGLQAHSQKFTLYTIMGLVTTAIFWGMETLFWTLWGTDLMRELGAVIGLAIGYFVKFHLDRRFVFPDSRLGEPS